MKKLKMTIITILTIVLIISLCYDWYTKRDLSYTDADYYDECLEETHVMAKEYMPSLDELGEYESLLINRRPAKDLFFATMESIALAVSYNEENFEIAKNEISLHYIYLQKPIDDKILDINAEIDGIHFNIVEKCSNCSEVYCTHTAIDYRFLTIGIDEENHRIIYLFHHDIEIDQIDNLDTFIEKSFYLEGII